MRNNIHRALSWIASAVWAQLTSLRIMGAMLGAVLTLNALLWCVDPSESLLFIFWSGSSGVAAIARFALALVTGLGLLGLWRARSAAMARRLALVVSPAVIWSVVDAASVWIAAWRSPRLSLDGVAWVPTSIVLAVVIALPALVALEQTRSSGASDEAASPSPSLVARALSWSLALAMMAGLLLHHVSAVGATDYGRKADTAVVFGARAYRSGRPSRILYDRVMTGVRLYKTGRVKRILMTGGFSEGAISEPQVMKRVAVQAGVPASAILIDEKGHNTAASVRNMAAIDRSSKLGAMLIVSNDHHLSRIRLACHRLDLTCTTVPARLQATPLKEPYYRVREVVGFVHYALTFR